ncbi:MAG: RIP metalloprotease RseP [Blastocatellales bacterium]
MGYVAFVVILCAMIVIHEFGHFIVAKMLGIAVETFSVGFGPRLIGFRIGETDYRISAIPLGGYVKFRGENMEMLQGESEGSIDEFLAHPKWKRFLVALAGPVFNIATALLIPAIGIMIGFRDSADQVQQPVIGRVMAGSAAEKAGLQPGDRILNYHGRENPKWRDIELDVMLRPGETIPLTVERSGSPRNLALTPSTRQIENEKIGESGIEPYIGLENVRVLGVRPDMPAGQAGLKAGDRIVSVNGQKITAWHQFKDILRESEGRQIALQVERDSGPAQLNVTPVLQDGEYKLGFAPDLSVFIKTTSFASALKYGWEYNWMWLRLTGVAFKQIFSGRRSARDAVGGPVKIAQETVNTYDVAGWAGTVKLMGMLSLNLGIFNLLPIPVLDGGVILLIIIESLMGLVGLTLTMNVRERFQQVGFVMVLLLMGFVFVNDFVNLGRSFFNKPVAQEVQTEQKK